MYTIKVAPLCSLNKMGLSQTGDGLFHLMLLLEQQEKSMASFAIDMLCNLRKDHVSRGAVFPFP